MLDPSAHSNSTTATQETSTPSVPRAGTNSVAASRVQRASSLPSESHGVESISISDEEEESVDPGPALAFNYETTHAALDRNGDEKVTRQDLGIGARAFHAIDANHDGRVSKREHRADFYRRNSFEHLDRDADGRLSRTELASLERFTTVSYDANGDGSVDADEFVDTRRKEMNVARLARIEGQLADASEPQQSEWAQRFDANGDGRLTASEMLQGRREAREHRRTERANEVFETYSGGRGSFDVQDARQYAAYDVDGDGRVSREEFQGGQANDHQVIREDRFVDGGTAIQERKRLGIDAAGRDITGVGGSLEAGDLKHLTWDRAISIIRAQGGRLFAHGQPTVLAVRTANAGTTDYEDVFVVLKPNGSMKAFAATTRPSFTQDGGGWTPGMVVAGNYHITPRWRDGKFNNDAFIVGTQHGMSVPFARDSNGDGEYSKSEIAASESCDEIRLHRGNGNSTSSAGCFNVRDYDAFLQYIGGRDVTFDFTVVEG